MTHTQNANTVEDGIRILHSLGRLDAALRVALDEAYISEIVDTGMEDTIGEGKEYADIADWQLSKLNGWVEIAENTGLKSLFYVADADPIWAERIPLNLSEKFQRAVENFTDLRCTIEQYGHDPRRRMWKDARSEAVEALIRLLRENPDVFDYVTRLDGAAELAKGRNK